MSTGCYQKKRKKDLEKRLVKGVKIFQKKKKIKRKTMVGNNINILLKKKKIKRVSMNVIEYKKNYCKMR